MAYGKGCGLRPSGGCGFATRGNEFRHPVPVGILLTREKLGGAFAHPFGMFASHEGSVVEEKLEPNAEQLPARRVIRSRRARDVVLHPGCNGAGVVGEALACSSRILLP